MSNRASLWIGFLAGGWFATLLLVLMPALGIQIASAEDPPVNVPRQPFGPNGPPMPGPTVNPDNPGFTGGGRIPPYAGGTGDSNGRSIALAASIGGGESAVYYFDTVEKRLLVYQYKGLVQGSLKLEGYRDLSQQTRNQLKGAFESTFEKERKKRGGSGPLPTKKVGVNGGGFGR